MRNYQYPDPNASFKQGMSLILVLMIAFCFLLAFAYDRVTAPPLSTGTPVANAPTGDVNYIPVISGPGSVTDTPAPTDAQPSAEETITPDQSAAAPEPDGETSPTSVEASPTFTPQPAATLTPTPTNTIIGPTLTPTTRPVTVDVEALLGQLSLEQKVGQMIVGVIPGTTADATAEQLIFDTYVGGFIYYEVNVADAAQIARLSNRLQELSRENSPDIPLFIIADYEADSINNYASDVPFLPPAMAVAATNSTQRAYDSAAMGARMMKSLGINMILRPVLDVNRDPDNPVIGLRSFGSDVERVSAFGNAFISGLQDNGVIAVAKHFPGHGDTDVDSHGEIAPVNKPLDVLEDEDLPPFAAAIRRGVGGIMMGHISNQYLDVTGDPASLSTAMTTDLLRVRMGYQGLIITDSLTMVPIKETYGIQNAALRAVAAGSDVLLFSNPNDAQFSHAAIVQAVRDGRISTDRIDASVRRILTIKAQYGLFSFPTAQPQVNRQEFRQRALEIARRAVYAPEGQDYPLLENGSRVVVVSPNLISTGSSDSDNLTVLGEMLAQRGFDVVEFTYPPNDGDEVSVVQGDALRAITGNDTVLLATWNASLLLEHNQDAAQAMMIDYLYDAASSIVFVPLASPYDMYYYPPNEPVLVTFGAQDVQLQALVEALTASFAPDGILPVELQ